jgi:hypothetical protein
MRCCSQKAAAERATVRIDSGTMVSSASTSQ